MNTHNFIAQIRKYIHDNRLLSYGQKHLVAFSGGADSTALLLVLHELGYEVDAVHCNFHLRGDESDRDEAFCKALCREKGIELHIAHFDTRTYASLHKVSIEMAARDLRYGYFHRLRQDIGAESICVAHHRDDTVETVLMNLVRGTGIHGLAGIRPRNGHVVRPMLCVGRTDIEEYMRQTGQDYVTDSTNLVDDVTRNKLRLDVLPLLQTINPTVNESIAKTARRMSEAIKLFDTAIEASAANVSHKEVDGGTLTIDIEALCGEPSPEYALFYLLQPCGFSPAQIEQIYDNIMAHTGREWRSGTHQLLIDRGQVIVEPLPEGVFKPFKLPEPGRYVLPHGVATMRIFAAGDGYSPSKTQAVASLDADKVQLPITVRLAETGDRFAPFGMKGMKLVSDYLTDRKLSLFAKRRQLVACDATGSIVWLVCERPDNRFRITDTTKRVLEMTFEHGSK